MVNKYISGTLASGYVLSGAYTSVTIGTLGMISLGGLLGGTSQAYTIFNLGSVIGGVTLQARGTIVNGDTSNSKALIAGGLPSFGVGGAGIKLSGGGSIGNFGSVTGGVTLHDGGTITNGDTSNSKALIAGGGVFFGVGGAGIDLSGGGSIGNWGTVAGGAGGLRSFNPGGGSGASGGAGITLSGGGSIDNTGTIAGGHGGYGEGFGDGGYGGGGINLSGGSIHNTGTIVGGRGGDSGRVGYKGGSGGAGITLSGGSIGNSGTIAGGQGGVASYANLHHANGSAGAGIVLAAGGGSVTNGSLGASAALISGRIGVAAYGTAGATVTDYGTISGSGGVAVSFGGSGANYLILGNGYKLSGTVEGSNAGGASNTLALAGTVGSAATVNYNGLGLTDFQDVLFGPNGYNTLKVSNTGGMLSPVLSGFSLTSDVIDMTAIGSDGTITQSGTMLTVTGSSGSVTFTLDSSDSSAFATASDGTGGTELLLCFCRGTRIETERGEVAVEELTIGDRVATLSGAFKPIVWIGMGRNLVTRANRLARPVVVRAGALADNVPRRDLYLTHGHALYVEGVLIPVENLINHRSIAWDETARVVEYYHIELEDHDVVLAEGAPAETYYDAGNRALFQNTREGSEAGADKPTCAPVLQSGDVVGTVWATLFERAGGSVERNTTDEADIHLVVDGERLNPAVTDGFGYTFVLDRPPAHTLRLCSRSCVPSLVGLSRDDHRKLGVPIKQIVLNQFDIPTCFDYDAPQFREGGCHVPEDGYSWTDGEFDLPARFFTALNGAFILSVHIQPHSMRYPIVAPALQAA